MNNQFQININNFVTEDLLEAMGYTGESEIVLSEKYHYLNKIYNECIDFFNALSESLLFRPMTNHINITRQFVQYLQCQSKISSLENRANINFDMDKYLNNNEILAECIKDYHKTLQVMDYHDKVIMLAYILEGIGNFLNELVLTGMEIAFYVNGFLNYVITTLLMEMEAKLL